MEHAAHLVDILSTEGEVVGTKPRRDIDKTKDIYHVIFVLLITPKGELVLSMIPPREDLPNLYARKMGATIATIRRSNETPAQAARRGVQRELFIDRAKIRLLGQQMIQTPGSPQSLVTVFYMVGEPPATYSVIDIDTLVVVTPQQLRGLMLNHPNEIAPTLKATWDLYGSKLPI
jgi:hypothetical protein